METVSIALFTFTGMLAFVNGNKGLDVLCNMIGWAGAWMLGFFLFQAGPFG